jgi:hypothetical protein
MPKKSLKDAAQAGTSVFDTIAAGGGQYVQDVPDVKDVKTVPAAQDAGKPGRGRPKKTDGPELVRLNLKIPVEIKEYLQEAAYLASNPRKIVSLTEYLCDLVRADMEKHKGK